MLAWLSDPQIWASLLTLTALEIVLGIDNVIFVSIVADRLNPEERPRARMIGLGAALLMRIGLLSVITWIIGLTTPVFTLFDFAASWRDIILFAGGLFLLYKSTHEIHQSVEEPEEGKPKVSGSAAFAAIIVQIMILDIVFSIDSIVTAVGMADNLSVMIAAVIASMIVMLFAAGPIGDFVSRHPTVKMLALSFLLLIGVALIADGLHFHIPKGYIYFAVAFSVLVECLNLFAMKRRKTAANAR